MKLLFKTFFLFIILSLFFNLPAFAIDTYKPSTGYHNYKALTKSLEDLAKQNKKITKLSSIGKTLQGRDIWMIQISGDKGKAPEEKQALLICGNLEADHVVGSEVALGIAEKLVSGYGSDLEITNILDSRTFYIIPRINPDGAEMFFEKTLTDIEGNLKPRDDDYDWLIDEDGPEDLNGDGLITLMRVKDKDGEWFMDSKDNRVMFRKKQETSLDSLYSVYPEGIDNDGDELYNEDGPGGFNINRNFPHNFGYDIKGLGVYPASKNETRAVIDFMNRYIPSLKTQPHKNICSVLIFSKFDNLAASPGIECGKPEFPEVRKEDDAPRTSFRFGRRRSSSQGAPGGKAKNPQPQKTEDKDLPLFKKVSENYKKITHIESAVSEKPFGSMLEWAYFQYGVPSFSSNLWSPRNEKKDKPEKKEGDLEQQENEQQRPQGRKGASRQFSGDRISKKSSQSQSKSKGSRWLNWIEKNNNGVGFVDWETFQHKQLGEVEIGGFYPYLKTNAPHSLIDSLSQSHAKFALYLASQFAEIKMDSPEIKKLSTNLYELKIKVHNTGKFPYATEMGQKSRNVTPIVLRLKFEDDESMKLFGGEKRHDLRNLEPGAEKEYKWVIISPPGKKIDFNLLARKGGGKFNSSVVLE